MLGSICAGVLSDSGSQLVWLRDPPFPLNDKGPKSWDILNFSNLFNEKMVQFEAEIVRRQNTYANIKKSNPPAGGDAREGTISKKAAF